MIKIFCAAIFAAASWFGLRCPASAAQEPLELTAFLDKRAAFALELSKPIAECVQRRDTSHPAFHGCIDWHSAVHGTWALTAYTSATGDERYKPLIESLLQPELLAKERKHLEQNPMFEMPYGRAWFLRLAIDHHAAFNSNRLDDFADDVAQSLIAYYTKAPPEPTSIAYNSATWALINLYDYGVARDRQDILAFVRKEVLARYITSKPCPLEQMELAPGEFMAVCTNWAWLVGKALDHDAFLAWLPKFLPASLAIEPITKPMSIHENGLNFSRAWGLWDLYRKTGDRRFLDLYLRHFNATYENPKEWKGPYELVGHWVAQFGMLALMVTY